MDGHFLVIWPITRAQSKQEPEGHLAKVPSEFLGPYSGAADWGS